mgnify:CR=1 FL=1
MTGLSTPGHPFQYAWHVPDMDSAVDYWANTVGVGPFFVNEVDFLLVYIVFIILFKFSHGLRIESRCSRRNSNCFNFPIVFDRNC